MSYILEALKKAQAERQLGNAPTLDTLPVHPPLTAGARRALSPSQYALAALAALVMLAAAAAAAFMMQWWRPAAPARLSATVVPLPEPVAVPVPAPVAAPAPAPAPAAAPPLVVAAPSAPARDTLPPALRTRAAETLAPAPAPAPAVPAPVAAAQARLPTLRELPDNVRAAIPQLRFGGYMYSNDPADRLILVDKVLRHEGEEVAPGLVLEKLLPKGAQMNYRGTRYVVPI